jgi:leader peptidase (prepilin peptidase) / N-methyltransferase
MLLPNRILLPFTPVFILARILFPGEQPLWHYGLGALLGGGIIILIIVLSRGGMGMGDAKLFALCGWVVGFPHTLIALLLACLMGTLVGGILLMLKIIGRKQPIPFGPFLALGTILSYAYGTQFIDSYLSIFT